MDRQYLVFAGAESLAGPPLALVLLVRALAPPVAHLARLNKCTLKLGKIYQMLSSSSKTYYVRTYITFQRRKIFMYYAIFMLSPWLQGS